MDRILNNLGLCTRASGLIAGEEIVCDYARRGKVYLIFLANDASDNAKKKILDKAKFYNVEVNMDYSSSMLNQAIGKTNRMVLGITKESFVKILKK